NYLNYFTEGPGRQLILKEGLYEISEPLIIPRGYKVIINEGVQINIINRAAFISYSTVCIKGTADKPVIIKSSDGTANGFSVFQASERSLVEYAVFDRLNTLDKDGWTLTGAVTFYESDVDFYNTSFQNNLCEDGLNIIRSDFVIDQCELINTFSDALDVDFGTGTISNTEFRYLNNDGIDVSGSDIKINHCFIRQSNDKGISGGENSIVLVENTTIEGSEIGIASKDFSRVHALNCTIEDCRYGIVVFRKKPEFGTASFIASDLILNNVTTTYLIEEGSTCTVDGIEIMADKNEVYDMFYN
ncbi:MAG: right-handed parallel beta-helix repeat-containing protein, partial [Bacteroidota bacterium]|nr:right-handed parallel beta-helix repeat-containing protein [Bacteroidota bacterium]